MVSHAAHAATVDERGSNRSTRRDGCFDVFRAGGITGNRTGQRLTLLRAPPTPGSDPDAQPVRSLDEVQDPAQLDLLAHRQFDAELGRPGDDRPEQRLIVHEDHNSHGQDRRPDRRPFAWRRWPWR